MSHWTYRNEPLEEIPEGEIVGFVYLITNTVNGKKYIGRKYVSSVRRKALTAAQKKAGRVRKTVVKSASNWKSYAGSSKPLLDDIKLFGKDKFKFEILAFAETKGQVNYMEIHFQCLYNCILRDDFYNDSLGSNKFVTMKNKQDVLRIITETQIT